MSAYEIAWLLEITSDGSTHYWSTANLTWNAQAYMGRLVEDSFAGVTENRVADDYGLANTSDLTFEIHSVESIITDEAGQPLVDGGGNPLIDVAPFFESRFQDQTAVVRFVVNGTQQRVWTMRVKRCEIHSGLAHFYLEPILNAYLEGEYPLRPHPRDVWPSSDVDPDSGKSKFDDQYVIPQVFGEAYIPLRSVNPDTDRYYVLGPSEYGYSTQAVHSPKEWDLQTEWTAPTVTQSTKNGYKVFQAKIADSNGDGTYDANGVWKSGDTFLDMPTKFVSTEITSSQGANPALVLYHFFQTIGIPTTHIDTGAGSSFEAAETQYDTWGIEWDGGWYTQGDRGSRLANLLQQCASTVRMTDKVELHPRSTTSQTTITAEDVVMDSFSYSPAWPEDNDGGYVEYIKDLDTPQDRPTKVMVWSSPNQTDKDDVENPESTTLSFPFVHDSQIAQKCGVLYFNRKQNKRGINSFTLMPNTNHWDLYPDQVISLNDELFGEDRNILIKSVSILYDGQVQIEAHEFADGIIDFDDLSPAAVTVVEDDTTAWQPIVEQVSLIGITTNNPAAGQAIIHGFNNDGADVTSVGRVLHDGEMVSVVRLESSDTWTLDTSQAYTGYIVYDTTKSGKFTVGGNAHSIAFCKKESDQWSYDNGTSWTTVTLDPATDGVIGELVRGASTITSATVHPYTRSPNSIVNQDQESVDLKNTGWVITCTFSSTDSNTVSWGAGDLTYADGTTYSIAAGNTGDMSAETFVYFDSNISTTSLQTSTTATDAVGLGKTFIGTAEGGTPSAAFNMGGGGGMLFTGNNLVANSITSTQINTGLISVGDWSGDLDYSRVDNGPPIDADNTQDALDLGADIADAKINGTTLISGGYIRTSFLHSDVLLVGEVGNLAFENDLDGYDLDNAMANGSTLIAGGYLRTNLIDVDDLMAQTITIESPGRIQSSGFVSGSTGWRILYTGNAEFNDVTVRGDIYLSNASQVRSDINVANGADVTANNTAADTTLVNGTAASTVKNNAANGNTAHGWVGSAPSSTIISGGSIRTSLIEVNDLISQNIVVNGGYIQTSNYSSGSSGWKINSTGDAEFNDVTIRGTLDDASVTSSEGLTISSAGSLRVDGEINLYDSNGIYFYDTSTEKAKLYCGGGSLWLDASENILIGSTKQIKIDCGSGYDITLVGKTKVTQSIIPSTTSASSHDLGDSTHEFGTLYVANIRADDVTNVVKFHDNVIPSGDGTLNLGSSLYAWQYCYVEKLQNPNGSVTVADHLVPASNAWDLGTNTSAGTWDTLYVETIANGNGSTVTVSDGFNVTGTVSAAVKAFEIDHPVDPENKLLRFSATESNKYGLEFWGTAQLVDGQAVINLDQESDLTPGTFEALCQKAVVTSLLPVDSFVQITTSEINGDQFIIRAADPNFSGKINWTVRAERKDPYIMQSESTDDNGHLINEIEKKDFDDAMLSGIEIESDVDRPDEEKEVQLTDVKGFYRNPEAYGKKHPRRRIIHKRKEQE